jgi:hypothetical protein
VYVIPHPVDGRAQCQIGIIDHDRAIYRQPP